MMNSYILCCNIDKCRTPLNEIAWVTRCMHVFCPGHGQAYFSNGSPQIHCPVCNEMNLREVDILQCEVNPSDMILAGIPPLKAISLASKSLKLWWLQIQEEQRLCLSKVHYMERRNNEMQYSYSKNVRKMKHRYQAEINNLKMYCNVQMKKIESLNNELKSNQEKLYKYKLLLASQIKQKQPLHHRLSPHWFSNSQDILPGTSPTSMNNSVPEFTFNENHFFNI